MARDPRYGRAGCLLSCLGITGLSGRAVLLLGALFSAALAALLLGAQAALYMWRLSPMLDTAGRQRMLTQSMLASAYLLREDPLRAAEEGARSISEFEEAMRALAGGGAATWARFPPEARPELAELEARWNELKPGLQWLLAAPDKHGTALFRERLHRTAAAAERQTEAAQKLTGALRAAAARRVQVFLIFFSGLTLAACMTALLSVLWLKRNVLSPLRGLASAVAGLGSGKTGTDVEPRSRLNRTGFNI